MYVIYGDTLAYQYMTAGADKEEVLKEFIDEVNSFGELAELSNVFATYNNDECEELQDRVFLATVGACK